MGKNAPSPVTDNNSRGPYLRSPGLLPSPGGSPACSGGFSHSQRAGD